MDTREQTTPSFAKIFVAHNDAEDSGNPMHNDDVARALNFEGALVPGVTVYGYMTHAVVAHYGEEWLESGTAQVRFRRPVYVGEHMNIKLESDNNARGSVAIAAVNPDGEKSVVGLASMDAMGQELGEIIDCAHPLEKSLPEKRWPATREACGDQGTLGTYEACFDPTDKEVFLDEMQETHEVYKTGVTHPAWLLRLANYIVDANVELGPWIHVESQLKNFSSLKDGERVQIRGKFVNFYERGGREYADMDAVLVVPNDGDRLVMRVLHRFIYKVI
mgnify:CR=1 FL=1